MLSNDFNKSLQKTKSKQLNEADNLVDSFGRDDLESSDESDTKFIEQIRTDELQKSILLKNSSHLVQFIAMS